MSRATITVLHSAPERWNEWVAAGQGGPYQSSQFAEYWAAMLGYRPVYLLAGSMEAPISVLLAFSYSPVQRWLCTSPVRSIALRHGWRVLRCVGSIDGPAVLHAEQRQEVTLALLERARDEAGWLGGIYAKSVCHWGGGESLLEGLAAGNLLHGALAGVRHTPIIRLGASEEASWQAVPKEARKAVRRAESQGIEVLTLNGGEVDKARWFWELCNRAKGGRSYGDRLPVLTSRLLARGGFEVRYFIAQRNSEPIAGLGLHAFGGIACEIAAWSTPAALSSGLGGGDIIKWAVIKWCCNHEVRLYDLMGIAVPSRSPKEEGIARFKRKWAREVLLLHSFHTRGAVTSP